MSLVLAPVTSNPSADLVSYSWVNGTFGVHRASKLSECPGCGHRTKDHSGFGCVYADPDMSPPCTCPVTFKELRDQTLMDEIIEQGLSDLTTAIQPPHRADA